METKNSTGELIQNILFGNKAFFIVLILGTILSFASPYFFSFQNIIDVVRQVCVSTLLAIGFTIVLSAGFFDLSVGMAMGFLGVVLGQFIKADIPIPYCLVLVMIGGVLTGALNAGVITVFKINPFIATLATMSIFRGANYLISGQITTTDFPASFVKIGQGSFLGIPIPVYIMLIVVLLAFIFMKRTKLGFHLVATGGNAEAARVNGIDITRMRFLAYILCGLCVAIAAVIMTARTASAQVGAGTNMELDAIAAVVIGGTSLSGGNANIWGTLFGCLVVGFVNNGLNLLNIDPSWQVVAKGILILLAVVLDTASTGLYTKKTRKL